ncbi:MAG: IS1182 family transposase [Sedimentisphaerales bacterium]|nr:IS1182 family transposase [Sedimentisphaerales bacterium]
MKIKTMLGKKDFQEKLFLSFSLSHRVPETNFYRRLKKVLDLQFIRDMARPYYGSEGQKSIDPTVFFRLMLIGYLENIISDRQLIEHVSMRMDLLFFIDYDIDEPLPWHSTISRTRNTLPDALFEEAFERVLGLCVKSGLVLGHTQAIDSAYIKANASLDSLEKKMPAEALHTHIKRVQEENTEDDEPRHKAAKDKSTLEQRTLSATPKQLKDLDTHQEWFKAREGGQLGSQNHRARYLSNKTHYSPVDPDARVAVKPGKPRQMYYMSSMSVDTYHHVITHMRAIHADRSDSLNLIDLARQTQARLKRNQLHMDTLLADTGFSNGENYKYMEDNKIDGYIPVHGQYEGTREGFTYEPEQDRWRCSQGKLATFKKIRYQKNQPEKHYRTLRADCKGCPLASKCIGKAHEKQIRITLYKQEYDRMLIKTGTRKGQYYKTLRQSTVEPVFGTLINFLGMRKINTRGIENANKVMLMAAIAYNLKKVLKYRGSMRRNIAVQSTALKTRINSCILHCFDLLSTIGMLLRQNRKKQPCFLVVQI